MEGDEVRYCSSAAIIFSPGPNQVRKQERGKEDGKLDGFPRRHVGSVDFLTAGCLVGLLRAASSRRKRLRRADPLAWDMALPRAIGGRRLAGDLHAKPV